ncbi:MAG: FixH family protein [Janthinobacterium lividum]
MRLQLVKSAALGIVLLCVGCANKAAPIPSAGTADWRIGLSARPAAPRQMDPAQFRVQITDRGGKPVTGAQVVVGLAMPAMDMGRNQVTALAGAAGVYTASGRFTMPGDWQVTVRADKGKAHQTQSFPITVQ